MAQRTRSARRVVVDGDAAAFAAGHVLVVVEAEAADMADGAELAALIAAADALAGILDDDQVAPAAISMIASMSQAAPHIWTGHDRPGARADGASTRLGIDA